MGVPKFYRFITDRYPCINKIVKQHEIPDYDNLYLDMNSIIHTCSHPTDSDVHFRIGKKEFSDEDIFLNVSRYVELIFCIVKPAKLLFLAFDGVAPRAKMNQQRANRFRVAKENNEAFKDKQMLQDNGLFDANCITPGTIFMAELIDHMKHFIAYKISTDPFWQKCKIILSGSEAPGEGEHKIMQFIRHDKAQPNYNNNTRHCLYSLDADLIMLGLCTHEPFFSLLRENVSFGKRKKMLTPEESDFTLLHLSLLREYLYYEFAPLKSKLKFDFDLEKIIDDWVLIGFLVGNDFIPQLPNLNIVDGALPFLYRKYIEILPTLNGYINEAGELNIDRFEKFIKCLSLAEKGLDSSTEFKQIENKIQKNTFTNDFKKLNIKLENHNSGDTDGVRLSTENDEHKTNVLKEIDFQFQRENYYRQKLKFDHVDELLVCKLVDQYIRAIQWTLSYYYHGCCSWSWFYPYHYAPFISDINSLKKTSVKFDMAKPLLPLQHLVAVLPPANSHLLPVCLQFLLTDPKSSIIDFYPENFETDLNGKTNDWEAIVLIPFIDEEKLVNAMQPFLSNLNMKERKRNINGFSCIFTYTNTNLGQYPVDTAFNPFINHAQLEFIKPEDMFLTKNKLIPGLCQNVCFNLSFAGFPTFKYIPHTHHLEIIREKNLNYDKEIKRETMVLNVSSERIHSLEEVAKKLLGQTVYINWPYLQEAHVIGITDFKDKIFLQNFWKKYTADNLKHSKLSDSSILNLQNEKVLIADMYKKNLSINIGETQILIFVFPIMGKRFICGKQGKEQLQCKWSSLSKVFPYQLIVKEIKLQCVYNFSLYKSVSDIFAVSKPCFVIGHPNYGSVGEIKNVILKNQVAHVALKANLELNILQSNEDYFIADTDYVNCNVAAKKLKTTSLVISRITGSLIITEESDGSKFYDIGLRIKSPKYNKELAGYTQKRNDSWFYSSKAVELIRIYMEKFPDIFININKNSTASTFTMSNVFPEGKSQLDLVKSWLVEQETFYTTFLECGTKTLGVGGVPRLEKFVSNFLLKEHEPKIVNTHVPLEFLFRPGTIIGLVPPDIKAQHKLLDRVVCIRDNFTVPLGFKGTIIGIQEKEDKWKNVYEVLFDFSFTGGLTLYESSEHKCYRLSVADFINISFGQRDQNVTSKQTNHIRNSKAIVTTSSTTRNKKFDKPIKVEKPKNSTNNEKMLDDNLIKMQSVTDNKTISLKTEKKKTNIGSNRKKSLKATLSHKVSKSPNPQKTFPTSSK